MKEKYMYKNKYLNQIKILSAERVTRLIYQIDNEPNLHRFQFLEILDVKNSKYTSKNHKALSQKYKLIKKGKNK